MKYWIIVHMKQGELTALRILFHISALPAFGHITPVRIYTPQKD
jgi:hypothetical protein